MVRSRPENYRFYNLTRDGRIAQIMAAGFIMVFVLLTIGASAQLGVHDLRSQSDPGPLQVAQHIAEKIVVAALFLALPVSLGLTVMHRFADIGIGPDGLAVQVYLFFWALVPWDSIVAVDSRWLPGESSYDQAIILVRQLTIWHRFVTAAHMMSLTPGIPITTYHEHWRELLQTLNDQLAARAPHDNLSLRSRCCGD